MKSWLALQEGDCVDLIAPGYAVTEEVLLRAVQSIKSFGFKPRVPERLLEPQYFHSNSDEMRFEHLKRALLSPDSKAVWCLRGGYGSNRLVPALAKLKVKPRPKAFIGISDVTSLHFFLNQKWHWATLHASLIDRIAKGNLPEAQLKETLEVLTGRLTEVTHPDLVPLNLAAKKQKKLNGKIRGGNLTTMQSLIGTPWAPRLKDCILFLEDIGERGYRVDRMLEHLVQAKLLVDCKAVVFGHFTGGHESNTDGSSGPSRVPEALQRFADLHPKLAVWAGVQSGHDICLRPVPLETPAVLQHGILSIQTGCKVIS